MKFALYLWIFLLVSFTSWAQGHSEKNDQRAFTINMSYGPQLAMGDLSDRFGTHFNLGLDLEWVTKQAIIFGLKSPVFLQ